MSQRVGYGAAWALCSALLLTVGFTAVVALGAVIASGNAAPDKAALMPRAFAVYGVVVLIKGLLPALAVAFGLFAIARLVARDSEPSRPALALGLLVAAALGSAAAAAWIMPLSVRGIAAVHFTGTANFLRTCAEMTLPVALAAWLPRVLLPRTGRSLAVASGVLALLLAAGGAAYARLLPAPPPTAMPQIAPLNAPRTDDPADAPAAPQTPADAPRVVDPAEIADSGRSSSWPESELGWEEIERRHAMAARIRKLIEDGPNATKRTVQGGLLAEGDPVPVYRDGNLAGIALQHVPPDGLYARLGLQEGDVVESVNGVAFDSPGAATAMMGALVSSSQIELAITRGNGSVQLAVPRETVLRELNALP